MPKIDVLLAVTGGIASFKSAALASQMVQQDLAVQVVMTRCAEKFIGKSTFAALTGRAVATDLFDPAMPLGAHIELARNSAVLVVAPATANFLAAAALGQATDLLSTLYLCFTGPVLVAPAMNVEMWNSKAVQRNVGQLVGDGVHIIEPQEGWLSCREKGKGRMADPDTIFASVRGQL